MTERPPAVTSVPIEELGRLGFALAISRLGCREDAADAVQDSLQQLVSKWQSFDPKRGELRAWFLKIVRNRCIDMLRRRSRDRRDASEVEELASPVTQTPHAVAERAELLELLKVQLLAMDEGHREIIVLRDFHNLSYAEIADVLSIPAGTVMSRLHRARTELRKRMEGHQ